MNPLAILGVGTGVGKTHVAAQLLRAAHAQRPGGLAPFKPLESGTDLNDGVPADAAALLEASSLTLPLSLVCPWPLPRPVAPAEELERCGIELSLDALVAAAERVRSEAQTQSVLVEGAGGVFSPLSWDFHALDLCAAMQAGIWLVVRDELGALSHALTALEVLRHRKHIVLGVILNRFDGEDSVEHGANQRALARLGVNEAFLADENGLDEEILRRSLRWLDQGEVDVRRR